MDGNYEPIREGFCEWVTAVFFLFLFTILAVPVVMFDYSISRDIWSSWEDIQRPACKWLMIRGQRD